jgi:hypothetical protein
MNVSAKEVLDVVKHKEQYNAQLAGHGDPYNTGT